MKKQQNKKKGTGIAKKKKLSSKAKKWIIVTSIAVGVISGFLLWYFVTRCGNPHCFFHNWPLKEVLFVGTFFALMPFAFFNKDLYKKYKR